MLSGILATNRPANVVKSSPETTCTVTTYDDCFTPIYSFLVELQLLTGVHCGVLLTAAGNALSIGPGAAGDVLIEACPTYARGCRAYTAYTRQQM